MVILSGLIGLFGIEIFFEHLSDGDNHGLIGLFGIEIGRGSVGMGKFQSGLIGLFGIEMTIVVVSV